ncbi:hypothetical protein [Actinomadura latina]|uniref:Uncharacterized protein n=1 Tax=Actinomadura latina TaxID=163603 RepID=A0A846Z5Z9_9ACTN|nr:hypothetical protein [Actinomadura latina]NKZ06075.1 hypothetical protein [Actinomadura latina]
MLAGYPDPSVAPGGVGDRWFLYIGPAVIFLAVIFWVVITLTASRHRPRSRHPMGGLPNRGPVQGGIIKGSPSQRTRRDPAPSVTHREVTARVEYGRLGEQAVREKEQAEAGKSRAERLGKAPVRAGRRPKRKRPGLFGARRRR